MKGRDLKMRNGIIRRLGILGAALAAGAALQLAGCEGSATQTTNGGVHPGELQGVLVGSDGRPVAGASVEAWVHGGGPGQRSSAQARTDGHGIYRLTGLEAGTYNVFAAKDKDAAMIPAVEVKDSGKVLDEATLKPAGKITGTVLDAAGPLEMAFSYVPGSSFVSITGEDGAFSLDRIPEGSYLVKYAATGFEPAADSVTVVAGRTVALPAKRLGRDVTTDLPAPKGLTAFQDSVTGVVTLTWRKVHVEGVFYHVRAYPKGMNPNLPDVAIYWDNVTDTVLRDTLSRTGFNPDGHFGIDGKGTMVYQVRVQDHDGYMSRLTAPLEREVKRPTAYKADMFIKLLHADPDTGCRKYMEFESTFPGADTEEVAAEFFVQYRLADSTWTEPVYHHFLARDPHLRSTDTTSFGWGMGDNTGSDAVDAPHRILFRAFYRYSYWTPRRIIELDNHGKGCFTHKPPRPVLPGDDIPEPIPETWRLFR